MLHSRCISLADFSLQNLRHVSQEGDSVSLICTADGKPDPTLTWMDLNNSRNISTKGLLNFPRIKAEDAGEYQCQAKNQLGAIKAIVNVIVECKRGLLWKYNGRIFFPPM